MTPVRKGSLWVFGEEGPEVEVLDAVSAVDVVEGGSLADGDAHESLRVEALELSVPAEQRGEIVSSERGEARQVPLADRFARPYGRPVRAFTGGMANV